MRAPTEIDETNWKFNGAAPSKKNTHPPQKKGKFIKPCIYLSNFLHGFSKWYKTRTKKLYGSNSRRSKPSWWNWSSWYWSLRKKQLANWQLKVLRFPATIDDIHPCRDARLPPMEKNIGLGWDTKASFQEDTWNANTLATGLFWKLMFPSKGSLKRPRYFLVSKRCDNHSVTTPNFMM